MVYSFRPLNFRNRKDVDAFINAESLWKELYYENTSDDFPQELFVAHGLGHAMRSHVVRPKRRCFAVYDKNILRAIGFVFEIRECALDGEIFFPVITVENPWKLTNEEWAIIYVGFARFIQKRPSDKVYCTIFRNHPLTDFIETQREIRYQEDRDWALWEMRL